MEKVYKKEFSNLLMLIQQERQVKEEFRPIYEDAAGNIFKLGGKQFGLYDSLVKANEFRASKAIEAIAVEFVKMKKLENFSLYPIEKQCQNLEISQQVKSRPFQLILKEDDKKIGIVFTTYDDLASYGRSFIEGKYVVDGLKLIIISMPNKEGYETFFEKANEFNKKVGDNIERVTIKEFWETYFGEEAFLLLLKHVDDFNNKAKELIGFSTVITPTTSAIKKFKNDIGKEIQRYNYIENIPKSIYDKQVDTLIDGYLNRGLWQAMIGNSNFALSFITSEWYYKMYLLTENLDLTNIVAGYLKSIEQLLYEIIKLSKDEGITIKTKLGVKEFSTDTEDIADITLNSLENVIKHNNRKLLDVNRYAQSHLINIVDQWREKHRNGYFHKHNLQSLDKVNEIRETAYYLYFLILGSFKIKEEQFEKLGIVVQDK